MNKKKSSFVKKPNCELRRKNVDCNYINNEAQNENEITWETRTVQDL